MCKGDAIGADCSIIPKEFTSSTIELFPRQWDYYFVDSSRQDVHIKISSDENEIHLYTKVGDAPSRSDFDGLKKGRSPQFIIEKTNEKTIVALHNPSKTETISVQTEQKKSANLSFLKL